MVTIDIAYTVLDAALTKIVIRTCSFILKGPGFSCSALVGLGGKKQQGVYCIGSRPPPFAPLFLSSFPASDLREHADPPLSVGGVGISMWEATCSRMAMTSATVEEVPPELPEPALGINFARDGMNERDWISLVAVHSDSWLLAVAFYFGARFGFDKDARRRLFSMINNLPSIFEVVSAPVKKPSKEKTPNSSSKKSNTKMYRQSEPQTKISRMPPQTESDDSVDDEEVGDDGEEEHENTLCGACGDNYAADEFWICCDLCERWFHGKCVKITPARAEHIKQYKCPACSNKRSRVS